MLLTLLSEHGHISFQRGTGGNVEITSFRVDPVKRGHGTALLKRMLRKLESEPPYHTIYGFTRTCNTDAIEAYKALGFTTSPVWGVYKDGSAVVFSAPYSDLCAKHLKDPDA